MKVLVLSNLYPPHALGGYELGCRDVVEALRARGHEMRVLTSSYGLPRPTTEGHVARWMELELGWDFARAATGLRLFRKEVRNRRAIRRMLREFRPDVVYVWALRYLSVTPVLFAQQAGLPVCFYSSDEWLPHWERRDRWVQVPHNPVRRAVKGMLDMTANVLGGAPGSRALDMRHVECTSAYIRDVFAWAGRSVSDMHVIHWGIDLARFPFRAEDRPTRTRLLYAGQLIEHKGVHTAVAAVERLVREGVDVTLTIVGPTLSDAYRQRLEAMASRCDGRVRLVGALPRERLSEIYAAHDMLIFPSIWQEPFSITLLEALASGLAVVSTATGGTPEILVHEHNALLFNTEDVEGCAAAVRRLVADGELYERLRTCGRATVERDFQLVRMIDQIERHLRQVAA